MRQIPTALFVAYSSTLLGQPFHSTGTEHWITFMENLDLQFNNTPSFHLVISSETAASGQVTVPATGFSLPFTVAAGTDTILTLPQNIYYASGDEAYFDYGVRVSADVPVSVYAYHDRQYFSEASMILPTAALGTDYLVSAREDNLDQSPSEFVVLATRPATVVEITPKVVTAGFRPPGVPFTITLDEGQSFQVQAYEDLTGSRVRSLDPAKPIAVFGGARQAMVNCWGGADDHLYDQIHPISDWGTSYTVVPFVGRGGDQVRVLAVTDGTELYIGTTLHQLDAGDVAQANITQPTVIHADQPIAVSQFNDSQSCNGASGDPFFLYLPHAGLKDHRCIWNSRSGDGTPEHFVNIVVQAGAGVETILLDGTDISGQFAQVPGTTDQWWAGLPLGWGSHELMSGRPFHAVAYGFGDYNGYGFALGFEHVSTIGIGELETPYEPRTQVVTQGSPWMPLWNTTGSEMVRVSDMRGRLVVETMRTSGVPVETSTLGKGIYLYERWATGQRIGTGRLAVE